MTMNKFSMKAKSCALAAAMAACFAASSTVTAEPIYINTGTDLNGDGNSLTAVFQNLGLFPDANSIYNELGAGKDGILKNGEILSFADAGSVLLSALKPLNPVTGDVEGFNSPGNGWTLQVDYQVSGFAQVVVGADIDTATVAQGATFGANEGLLPQFVNGTIKVYLVNPSNSLGAGANGQQLLQLNLQGGSATLADVTLFGALDYSWYGGGKPLVENFFNFADNGTSFYQNATAVPPVVVTWNNDFNVNPNLIPYNHSNNPNWSTNDFSSQPFAGSCGRDQLCRATNLNMTVRFDAPEPATLALLGLGLLGVGVSRRNRKSTQ